jgi:hypothetical protein
LLYGLLFGRLLFDGLVLSRRFGRRRLRGRFLFAGLAGATLLFGGFLGRRRLFRSRRLLGLLGTDPPWDDRGHHH